jgi:D-aminoacyl-tRNA deacylase
VLAIVVSRADSASELIGEQLLSAADWTPHEDATRADADGGGTYYRLDAPTSPGGVAGEDTTGADGARTTGTASASGPIAELREFDALHLELEDVADAFAARPDLLAFVSRHSGETGPLLSAHFTGNFGPAEYGGTAGGLARAAPNAQAVVVDRLATHAPDGYEVGIEGTHHGPSSVGAPSMFVELGSDEPQWSDPDGARAVARAVLDLAERRVAPDRLADGTPVARHLVGFGGGHYAPRFARVVRETDWAVGHVGMDWQLDALGDPGEPDARAVLGRAFERSVADYALVDGDSPALRRAIGELGYRAVSETWVRETDGVPLDLVGTLERTLRPVDEGLRFGDAARVLRDRDGRGGSDTRAPEEPEGSDVTGEPADSHEFVVVPLPDELANAARGIDADATRAAVVDATLAFETDHGGTEATGRAAVPDVAAREALIDDLVGILRERYDSVERVPAGDLERAAGTPATAGTADGSDGATVPDGATEVVVARERGFDPGLARTLGIPEGPAFGRLADGDAVEVDGRVIEPEKVTSEREDRFPVPAVD